MGRKLFRIAMHYLKSRDEAEDAVQDIMIKLWSRRDSLHEYRSLEAFAVTVIRNHCLDKLKMKHTVSINKLPNLLNRSRMEKTPLDILDERESVRRVKEIIDTLPEQQKSIIILRDIEQMEFEEIAEIMSMDMNLLRVTLSRARKKVRETYNTLYSYGLETYQRPS